MNWYDKYKEERILIQQEDEHNKFWAAHWDEAAGIVHIRWGRIGTKGQSQQKKMNNVYVATTFIDSKFREKQNKGYTDKYKDQKITQEILDQLAIEAAIVGTQNKCGQFNWVEVLPGEYPHYKMIPIERLAEPDCNPGLLVNLITRKEYDGSNDFNILFTQDAAWLTSSNAGHTRITKGHHLHELVKKVEEAIGRSLS